MPTTCYVVRRWRLQPSDNKYDLLLSINIVLFSASHVRRFNNMSIDVSQLYKDRTALQDSDAVDSLNSTTPPSDTGTKSRNIPKFPAFSFRMTFNADLSNAVDKRALLLEHISNRMRLRRPCYVISQIAFYDDLRLSGQPDIDGFVSVELHGYVQTNNGTRVPAMQLWVEEADWTAIPGSLAGDKDFENNMQRFEDENDALTRLNFFGSVGMNSTDERRTPERLAAISQS